MSDDPTKTAEPTENQGGGTTGTTSTTGTSTATITPLNITTVDETDAAAAEPTENQGGGSD